MNTTAHAPHARLRPAIVRWTQGFWADRFALCRDHVMGTVRDALHDPSNSARLDYFRIAAGRAEGEHRGTDWSDGDCYKWLEAVAHVYAVTGDAALDEEMDRWIEVIAAAQGEDGYLCTQIQTTGKPRWSRRMNHELYNFGHLFTAASVHHAATGKTTFRAVGEKAAACLEAVFAPRPMELARFGWNPSNIMGLVDLFRATGERRWLDLAGVFIDMRGTAEHGYPTAIDPDPGDQNQNTVPLRDEDLAVGHAVTATYLYAGAADVYAETGEAALLEALERIWRDMSGRKMHVTGAIGSFDRSTTERGHMVHEAFGKPYELPPGMAYNETCANIGNAMWNHRLLGLTGDARYADVMERVLYNSGLSGVSADGTRFCYTNPLRWFGKGHPWNNRDAHGRWFTHHCFCCPTQMARTLAHVHDWAASTTDDAVWLHLYSGCTVEAAVAGGGVKLAVQTDYPWDGAVRVTIDQAPDAAFAVRLRIPGWVSGPVEAAVNGTPIDAGDVEDGYLAIERVWQPGDTVGLLLPMPVELIEAHPMVEAARGQVAVQRGPVVYCVEAADLPDGVAPEDLTLRAGEPFEAEHRDDLLGGVTVVRAPAWIARRDDWDGALYRRRPPAASGDAATVPMIPYFAWRNRGEGAMSVWLGACS